MISVRELHLKSPGDAVNPVRAQYDSYRAADNQPGDTQPKADRVELSDGKGKLQVMLDQSFARFGVTERNQDEQGNVAITSYNGPGGWNPRTASMEGFEVYRTAGGQYAGSELKFVPGYETRGFYSYDNLPTARAEQQFHQYEARFKAEFSTTA